MAHIVTTKMSSKGQIIIPESVREELHLKSGDQFVVLPQHDAIILKSVIPPSTNEFSALVSKTRKAVKEAGITPKDLEEIIKEARK